MARVLAWMELSRAAFLNEQVVLLYLLHLLKDDMANWAEPHLWKVLEHKQGALSSDVGARIIPRDSGIPQVRVPACRCGCGCGN
jgi:hypothetical protein